MSQNSPTSIADDVNVTLRATKILNVVVGNRTLNRGEFSFELREKLANDTVSDTPSPPRTTKTATLRLTCLLSRRPP